MFPFFVSEKTREIGKRDGVGEAPTVSLYKMHHNPLSLLIFACIFRIKICILLKYTEYTIDYR